MDSGQPIQLVGMALLRGLIDESTLRRALDADLEILEALKAQGSLDAQDLEDLTRLVARESRGHSGPSEDSQPPTHPALPAAGRDPWDSLPSAGEETDGTGRQVLRVLTLPAWKQYRSLQFLAEGGMGRVFKAFDPTLKRVVALKFLRREDPELVARFRLEAQHQAGVDHPNICKVFEVGEWQGQSYIAMQFIKGETLETAAPGLSLADRVTVMEAVAEAVHAAHRQGLIHRDIKPANILVEPGEHGPKPTILDFGLAKGLESSGMTVQGLVIGTTHYMAPEQARGDHAAVGRRTDVYGLGATLHKVLTGQAPFSGSGGMDVLRRTQEEDIPSLARLVPGIPEDLDTIVRKCLEKDPARRYETALALAEDLRRWREGEPILARRPTLRYRAGKWARRHRMVVGVAGVALVALLATGAMGLRASMVARAQTRYAQHFGQEAERIEALRRYACLLSPHNVEVERAEARRRLEAVEREARRIGSAAEAPAAYALGRGYLALGEGGKAREFLEKAWRLGLRAPELNLALGRALAAAYQQERDLARALPSKELREARQRELARELKEPALAHLRDGAPAALESPTFFQAQVALMEGRWREAQGLARQAFSGTAWLFDAQRLEGEALLEEARELSDPAQALERLDRAEEALAACRRTAPSDPFTALEEVRVLAERASRELASGRKAEPTLHRCREAAARVRCLSPRNGEAPARLARALGDWTTLRPPRDTATRSALGEALALSAEAVSLEPENPSVLIIRATLLLIVGRHRMGSGIDPRPQWQEALELARKAQGQHPQEPAFGSLVASACMRKMTWEMNSGTPPWASFEEGLRQARALRERFPELPGCYQGLASLWVERAEFERIHGLDPRPSVASALEAMATAEARGLRFQDPGWTKGDAHLIRGGYLLAVQGDGEEDFEKAAAGYQEAFQANPNLLVALGEVAGTRIDMAQGRLERGMDPGPALAEAEAHLDRIGNRSSDLGQTLFFRGRIALLRGRWLLASGVNPGPEWARAEAAFRKVAPLSSYRLMSHVGRAEVRARAFLRWGRVQDRMQALASAREALVRDPLRAEAWLWIAAVEQEALRRGDGAAGPKAREAWAKALSLDANLGRWAKLLGKP